LSVEFSLLVAWVQSFWPSHFSERFECRSDLVCPACGSSLEVFSTPRSRRRVSGGLFFSSRLFPLVMLVHSGFDVYSDQGPFVRVLVPLFLLFGDGVYASRSLALGMRFCWEGQHFEVLLLGVQAFGRSFSAVSWFAWHFRDLVLQV
jgi:hypothetical protein